MNKIIGGLGVVIIVLMITIFSQYELNRSLREERNTYRGNTQALLSDMKRMQVDSTTAAVDVKILKLTLDEYKHYRAEDLAQIKKLNVKVESLQSAAKQNLEVKADIKADIKDTLVVRDTVTIRLKKVEMNTPYLQVNGMIEDNRLTGKIFLPVNLYQAIWVEHKHRFLWWKWGVKAVHQTISSDNPHVLIKYSEMISIGK